MYINRVTAKDDVILGTTTLNRLSQREKETIGMFTNINPLRVHFNDEMNFNELIDVVSKEGLRLLKHQRYPYDLILKEAREKFKVYESIFDIVLIYLNGKFEKENRILMDIRLSRCTLI
jgi:non-ribosomal peptide synthetase component F